MTQSRPLPAFCHAGRHRHGTNQASARENSWMAGGCGWHRGAPRIPRSLAQARSSMRSGWRTWTTDCHPRVRAVRRCRDCGLRRLEMLKLFLLVCLLPASQWIADAVGARATSGTRWLSSWVTHYVLCVVWLAVLDHGGWQQTASAAAALTWTMRTFHFLKRLPASNQ
jgi:hypothetical protein